MLRAGPFDQHAMRVRVGIAGVDQPRPIALEDRQHDIEDSPQHLLEVGGALYGPVHAVQALVEPQLRPAFLLGVRALRHEMSHGRNVTTPRPHLV